MLEIDAKALLALLPAFPSFGRVLTLHVSACLEHELNRAKESQDHSGTESPSIPPLLAFPGPSSPSALAQPSARTPSGKGEGGNDERRKALPRTRSFSSNMEGMGGLRRRLVPS